MRCSTSAVIFLSPWQSAVPHPRNEAQPDNAKRSVEPAIVEQAMYLRMLCSLMPYQAFSPVISSLMQLAAPRLKRGKRIIRNGCRNLEREANADGRVYVGGVKNVAVRKTTMHPGIHCARVGIESFVQTPVGIEGKPIQTTAA